MNDIADPAARGKWNLLTFTTLLLISAIATAEPIVIKDYGGETSRYVFPDYSHIPKERLATAVPPANRYSFALQYPVESSLQVGTVAVRSHGRHIPTPVFIVGVDADSREWLRANADVLIQKKALGMVTNVASEHDFQRLQAAFPNLDLSVLPVDSIAEEYHLKHYPVLIDHEDILQ